MKFKNNFQYIPRATVLVATLLLSLIAGSICTAEKFYLSKGQIDPISLLAPPPLPNSAEQNADLSSVIAVHNSTPTNEIAEAHAQKKIYVFTFAPVLGSFFQSNSLPKTAAFFQRLHYEVQRAVDTGKDHW